MKNEIASLCHHSTKSYFKKIETAALRCSAKTSFSENFQKNHKKKPVVERSFTGFSFVTAPLLK